MSPNLPTANLDSQVPSTKAWILLLSLLTVLLLAGSWAQQPARGASPAGLAGSPAPSTHPAAAPLPNEHRVALESLTPLHQSSAALALKQ